MTVVASGPGMIYTRSSNTNLYNGQVYWYTVLTGYQRYTHNGSDLPSFHSRRRRGELLPFTDFNQNDILMTSSGGWRIAHSSGTQTWVGSTAIPNFSLACLEPSSAMMQQMIADVDFDVLAAQAAANLESGFDALTFLAEFREVIPMVRNAVPKFVHLLKQGKERKLSLNDAVGVWMEGRYGWRPFVNDLCSLHQLLTKEKKRSTFYKSASRASCDGTLTNDLTVTDGTSWRGVFHMEHTYNLSAVARAISKYAPSRIVVAPLVTAWELIPMSFVVDWFLSVGTSLKARHALYCHPDMQCGIGYKLDITSTGELEQVQSIPPWTSTVRTYAVRTASHAVRHPVTPSFKPSTHLRFDGLKAIDLASLVYQRRSMK